MNIEHLYIGICQDPHRDSILEVGDLCCLLDVRKQDTLNPELGCLHVLDPNMERLDSGFQFKPKRFQILRKLAKGELPKEGDILVRHHKSNGFDALEKHEVLSEAHGTIKFKDTWFTSKNEEDHWSVLETTEDTSPKPEEPVKEEINIPEGFIKWEGGTSPVSQSAYVSAILRDGTELEPRPSQNCNWAFDNDPRDIVAYLPLPLKTEPQYGHFGANFTVTDECREIKDGEFYLCSSGDGEVRQYPEKSISSSYGRRRWVCVPKQQTEEQTEETQPKTPTESFTDELGRTWKVGDTCILRLAHQSFTIVRMTDDRVYDKTNGWTPKKSFNEENRIFSLGEIDKLMKYVSKSDETRTLKKELSSTKKERDGFRDKCQELRDNIQTANTRIESLTQDVENHSDAHASTKREFEEFKQLRERELYSFCNRKRVFEKEVKTLKEDLDKANRYVNIHQDEAKLHQDNAQDLAAQLDEINERIENQWSTKVSKLIRKVVA